MQEGRLNELLNTKESSQLSLGKVPSVFYECSLKVISNKLELSLDFVVGLLYFFEETLISYDYNIFRH